MVLGTVDQFVKDIDMKTVISIVRERELGRSCWAVTQRGSQCGSGDPFRQLILGTDLTLTHIYNSPLCPGQTAVSLLLSTHKQIFPAVLSFWGHSPASEHIYC